MEKLSFKINDFEGPLDLILFLISKHKMNICDIEISALLSQYLSYIEDAKNSDMELASEFLEMAARLVHIKTVMLLPKHEEQGDQLKSELAGQLMEYQACKQAALLLQKQNLMHSLFTREQAQIDMDMTYQGKHKTGELFTAYRIAMGKGKRKLPPPAENFSGIVTKRIVSVTAKIIYLLKRLYKNNIVSFQSVFEDSKERSDLVATFLALLELVKSGRVSVDEDCEEIRFHGR